MCNGHALVRCWRAPAALAATGISCNYHLLASGKIDVVIESDVNILDIAACVAIVTEAGGRCTELSGAAIDIRSTSILATNGRLHQQVLDALA